MLGSNKSVERARWRNRGLDLIEQRLLGHEKTDDSGLVSQAELQQDLQRFVTQFSERITQTLEPLTKAPDSPLYECALKRWLLYSTAALDIAGGPLPELNLLDMIVFMVLIRNTFERHWLPNVMGEDGRAVLDALNCSVDEIWRLAAKLINEQQAHNLRATIEAWEQEHPEQLRVEGVRFSEFSTLAADSRESRFASGILANVHAATRTADQAVLLGERFMFMAPRVPFIVRLHVRLATLQMISDCAAKLGQTENLLQHAHELRPMLGEVDALVGRLTTLARTATETSGAATGLSQTAIPLVQSIERMIIGPHDNRAEKVVHASDRLVGKTHKLLQQVAGLTGDDPAQAMQLASARLERTLRRTLWQVAALGAVWIVLFWGGYYLAR